MKLKTKKIIAREFLIFILIFAGGLIAFVSTYPYNLYWQKKLDKLNYIIFSNHHVADSLAQPYITKASKQSWYFEAVTTKFEAPDWNNSKEKLWTILYRLSDKDSISYRWEKHWSQDFIAFHKEIGFTNPDEFNKFIVSTKINFQDVVDKDSSVKLNAETNLLIPQQNRYGNKVLSLNGQFNFSRYIVVALFIIMFGVRYLYYGVRTSISILKQD